MSFTLARAVGNFIHRMLGYAAGCSGIVAGFEGEALGRRIAPLDELYRR